MKVLVAQLCPTLYDSMDDSPPSFPFHGILQARILEWVAMPSSRGSSFKVSSLIRNSRILKFWNFLVGFLRAVTASLPRTLCSTTEEGTRGTNEGGKEMLPTPPRTNRLCEVQTKHVSGPLPASCLRESAAGSG